jgi:hypothetical protein
MQAWLALSNNGNGEFTYLLAPTYLTTHSDSPLSSKISLTYAQSPTYSPYLGPQCRAHLLSSGRSVRQTPFNPSYVLDEGDAWSIIKELQCEVLRGSYCEACGRISCGRYWPFGGAAARRVLPERLLSRRVAW